MGEKKKPVRQVLKQALGIGTFLANSFCKDLGINPDVNFYKLTHKKISSLSDKVTQDIKNLKQGLLCRNDFDNVKLLVKINCFRGQRHKQKLPVRGQRTKTI